MSRKADLRLVDVAFAALSQAYDYRCVSSRQFLSLKYRSHF